MRKQLLGIAICMLMCFTACAVTAQPSSNDSTTLATIPNNAPQSAETILFSFDAQAGPGAPHQLGNLGADWDGQYIWTTARSDAGAPHKIYKWTLSGTLLNTYNQPAQATTTWGFRDMAFDGTYLYSGSEDGFWKIDPATGATTLMFSSLSPMTIIRALEWVPTENMFYTGSFGLGWYKFSPDGTTKIAITNPGLTAVYGMAYDSINDSLWVFDQTGTPQTTIFEYNYHTGALTGIQHVLPLVGNCTAQIAGGLFYSTSVVTGKAVLGGMVQGTATDWVFGMKLGESGDAIAPTTSCTLEGNMSGANYITDVKVTLTAADNPGGSGVNKTYIKIDSDLWKEYAGAETVTGNGLHTIQYYSTDLAGNVETTKVTTFTIQYPSPITITIAGGIGITASFKNTGTVTLTGVSLSIMPSGGLLLIGKKGKTDTQDIAANATATLKLFVLGIGTISVTAKANEVQKVQQMKVILIFVH